MTTQNSASQIRLVHLSDLHFGPHHRFLPPKTPHGDRSAGAGAQTLVDSLQKDLEAGPWSPGRSEAIGPHEYLGIAVTGDLAEGAEGNDSSKDDAVDADFQFEEAGKFLKDLQGKPILGHQFRADNIFLVPGNHDVQFASKTLAGR
jgi:3',5'-cyclic AMP phosphodiesterase CpdA